MPREKKKPNSSLFRKTHIRQKSNEDYECRVIGVYDVLQKCCGFIDTVRSW